MFNADNKEIEPFWQRYLLALTIILFSFGAIVYFAYSATAHDENNNVTRVFNTLLPVFTTWVGTVIAFYFGKESFDSANTQIRKANTQIYEIAKKLTPDELAKIPITEIMRKLSDITSYKIPDGKSEKDINLKDIYDKMDDEKSRLPILSFNDSVRYIIHLSRIEKYLIEKQKEKNSNDSKTTLDTVLNNNTLSDFIEYYKKMKIEYGLNKAFVIVSAKTSIGEAKNKMEKCKNCQDIFVTNTGSEEEPIIGWVSNIRLIKHLRE